MNRIITILYLVIIFSLITACNSKSDTSSEVSIVVTPPHNFNTKDTIHVFGNFNDWQIDGDNAYQLNYENGKLSTKIPINKDNLFFTFVKNKNFNNAPASKKGKIKPLYIYRGDSKEKEVEVTLPIWTEDTSLEEVTHTLSGNIEFLKGVNMPQLNRKTDISIYLPPSYTSETSKSYPVVYMLDGQNVFDEFTAYSGEWKVDEVMERLIAENKIQETIVVAVNNGDRRFHEYMPWDYVNKFLGDDKAITKGEGELTMQFIATTLKPLIDEEYRTKSDVKHTGFVGSSLGGIMALYAGTEYSTTFGFVGAFSPSMSLLNDKKEDVLLEAINDSKSLGSSKIYFDMGKVEYDGYKEVTVLKKALLENGKNESDLMLVKDDLGRHCEEDWSKRFPKAIQWLLKDLD